MKKNLWFGALIAAAALCFNWSEASATPVCQSSGLNASPCEFNSVTFSMTDLGGGLLELEFTGALSATGNWTGIQYLEAFNLKPNGGTITGASVTNVPGWTEKGGGLSNGSSAGCNGAGANEVCFFFSPIPTPPTSIANPFALSNDVKLDVQFTGTNIDLSSAHLKLDFWTSPTDNCKYKHSPSAHYDCNATGDLLSVSIDRPQAVPGPMVGAGLPGLLAGFGALLAWYRRRRVVVV